MNTILATIFVCTVFNTVNCQNFDSFKWKNRLLLVFSHNPNSELLNEQIKILEQDKLGLEERKLIVFTIFPTQGNPNQSSSTRTIYDTTLFKQFVDPHINFKVVLIGLDGGTKHEQQGLLTKKTLYNLIDQMPMRREEMRKN